MYKRGLDISAELPIILELKNKKNKENMEKKCYYEVLEIEKTTSIDGIKKAYRKLAMKYHPDRNEGKKDAEAKFKEVGEAYGVLSDAGKRKQYDMFGHSSWGGNPFGGGWFQTDFDVGDIFESFFGGGFSGGGRQRSSSQRGEDLEYIMEIDLKTSIYGEKQEIEFNKKVSCETCDGDGGKNKQTCSECGGNGRVTRTSQTAFGVIQQTVACGACSGSGETFEEVCSDCHGEKRQVKKVTVEIDIPAGIDDGMVIKLTGEGNDGVGTKASGDLYVKFSVNLQEKNLERDGTDLHYKVEIDVIEAILGTQKDITLPILGKRTISIDPGTQMGTIIKNSGDGVKFIDRDTKWDLLIHVDIKIPKKLGKKEREFYHQVASEKKLNVLNKKGILEKLFG